MACSLRHRLPRTAGSEGDSMITIHKSTGGQNGKVRVTFTMPAIDRCECLYLVGWFDEWDESVYRMERTPEGNWSLTLELEAGCEYQYRFRTPDGRWLNDPAAPPAPSRFGLNTSFVVSANNPATSPLSAGSALSRPAAPPS